MPSTEKALQSLFIHLLNEHGVIHGLILKNILNMVPAIIDYSLVRERETLDKHTNEYTSLICGMCFDREEQRTRKIIRKGWKS